MEGVQINPDVLEFGLISFSKNDILKHRESLSNALSPLVVQIVEDLVDGKFEEVWNQPKIQQAIKSVHDKSLSSLSTFLETKSAERSNPLLEIIEPTLDSLDLFSLSDTEPTSNITLEDQYLQYLAGVCSLCIFVQQNWTGPDLSQTLTSYYEKIEWKSITSDNLKELFNIDGEYVSTQAKNLEYMFFAVLIFIKHTNAIRGVKTRSWWAMRTAAMFQKLLSDDSTSLKAAFENNMQAIKSISQHENKSIQALYMIEEGLHWYHYHNTDKARQCFASAQSLTGLNVKLTGMLGVRTKFQTFQTPQLVLQAESQHQSEDNNNSAVPTTLSHEDDVYFDKPQISESTKSQPLSIIDQVILICLCLDIKGRQAKDGLTQEEMMAFINRITESQANNNWMVYSMCLLIKSRLESEKSRTVEKSALQVQVLVDQFNDKEAHISTRMKHIFQLAFPSRWLLKKELGTRFLNIGAAATALQVFEELQMWEEIIDCYRIMDKTKKAEEVVREQLNKNPTPLLWCILGDLTNDRSCYETAWELSGKRIARAQRSLARMCVLSKQWEEAIQHYEIALAINPLFPKCWFTLGCAYMHKQVWDKAIQAFSRVVQIDPDDGEAWNNMASVYIQQNKKREAFLALQESVKHTRSDWRIWSNMLVVAMDIGEFQAAFQAYNQVLELNKHEIDLEILGLLCKVVVKDISDAKGFPGRKLEPQLKQLFTAISSKLSDWNIWRIMANYYKDSKDMPNCIEHREKQYRAVQTLMGWEHEASLFQKVATCAIELAKDYIEEGSAQSISAAKSALRGLLRKTEDNFSRTEMYKEMQQVYETILKLESK